MPEFKGSRQTAIELTDPLESDTAQPITVAFGIIDFNPTFEPSTKATPAGRCTRCQAKAAVFQAGDIVSVWVVERAVVADEMPTDCEEAIEFCREDSRAALVEPEHPVYFIMATLFKKSPFYGPKCDDHADVSLP